MNFSPITFLHEKIRNTAPTMRYKEGEDFELWRSELKNKLIKLTGFDRYEYCDPEFNLEYTKSCDGYMEHRFTIRTEVGYYLPCVIRIPTGPQGKLPLVICLQGHSNGFHISLGEPKYPGDEKTISGGDRDFAVRAVKEGCIALAVEQRNFGECSGKDTPGTNCYEPSLMNILIGRTTIADRAWDISRVLDVALDRFDKIDETRIVCLGNSGGGTATYYAACLDERIAVAVPSCAVCTYKDSIGAVQHCMCNYIPDAQNFFDMGDLAALIAPRKLIVVNGAQDNIFPQNGVNETFDIIKDMYKLAGAPDNCALVTGPGGHRFYADQTWPVLKEFLK